MPSFEITVRRGDGARWPVVVEFDSGDLTPIRSEGSFSYSAEELLSSAEVEGYGGLLGQALFQGQIYAAFISALGQAGERRLRVLLFVEDPALLGLRWERLCAPFDLNDWRLLATAQQAPFSHYLPSLTSRRFPPIGRRDLRALVVACSPQPGEPSFGHLAAFDEQAAVRGVQAALGQGWALLGHGPGAAGPPTLNQICERITAEPFTILHIVCHGALMDDGETVLFLARPDAPDQLEAVTGKLLIDRLKSLRGARGLPHLCFLSTCESAKAGGADGAGNFGGLAQRLVRELGVPAVVAMTEKVSITTANALAERFYQRLLEHGEVDSALAEATAGLQGQPDVTVPVLFSRLGGRPLFSEGLEREPSDGELEAGLEQLRGLLDERAPTLLDEWQAAAQALRPTLGAGGEALGEHARGERAAALAELDAICQEALDMPFAALAIGGRPAAYEAVCPFPGLRAFGADERRFFFGRRQLVERLAERLAAHPFLAVLGLSGSGKSSVVRAGLLPALQAADPDLRVAALAPGAAPLAALEAALGDAGPRRLVFIDQFEELFTLCADEGERRAFVQRMADLHAAGAPIVLTMRADFWGECAPHAFLREQMQAHQELVPPLGAQDLALAMEEQARTVGLRFEAGLSTLILDDVRGEPGAMPLLQHALRQLWERRRGRWLRLEEYEAIGGVQRAISHSADQIVAAASAQDPANGPRLRAIFLRLTRVDAEGGEAARDTRQRVAVEELVPAGEPPEPILALVQQLTDARLLVTSAAPDGARLVEVAHEALIRSWPRLRAWLDEDRARLRLLAGLRQDAREWAARQDEGLLLRGARLEEARALAAEPRFSLNAAELAFVQASARAAELALRNALNQLMIADAQAALFRDDPEQALALAYAALQIDPNIPGLQRVIAEALDRSPTQRFVVEGQQVVAWAAFSNNGVFALGCTVQGQVVVWNVETGAQTARLYDPEAPEVEYRSVGVTADGAFIFAGGVDGILRLWTTTDGTIQRLGDPQQLAAIAAIACTQDSGELIVAAADGSLSGWRQSDGARAFRHAVAESEIFTMALAPGGRQACCSTAAGDLLLVNLADGACEPLGEPDEHDPYTALAWSPNGLQLAAGTSGGWIELWNVADRVLLDRHYVHDATVYSLAFNSRGDELLSSSEDQTILLLDPYSFRVIRSFDGHAAPAYRALFSPDDRQVLSAAFDGTMRLWATHSPFQSRFVVCHNIDDDILERTSTLCYSPDGSLLAAGTTYGSIWVWSMQDGKLLHRLHSGARQHLQVASISISADNQRLTARFQADEELLSAWHLADGRELGAVPAQDLPLIRYATLHPDGSVAASGDGLAILLVNAQSGEPLSQVVGHTGDVVDVAFSPDGLLLVSASKDRTVRVWGAAETVHELLRLVGHTRPVNQVRFSMNGRYVATASSDRSVRLWEVETGAEYQRFFGHKEAVGALAFSPAGAQLASGGDDSTVRVWALTNTATVGSYIARRPWVPELTPEQRARYGLGEGLERPA